ncbi:MAG TPA: sigma-70 factor domain-containing protein, partial [Polyangiaceae bacterium]|nr:sigma-70 factor domain-containing protein [Polyangiaceae bacterium]
MSKNKSQRPQGTASSRKSQPAKAGHSQQSAAETEVVDSDQVEVVDPDEELDDDKLAAQAFEELESEVVDDQAALTVPKALSKSTALTRSDPLAAYMREVERHALLTREQEHELAVHYTKTGDVDAAARLVTANLRLVVKLAYEYRRAYKNMMDL